MKKICTLIFLIFSLVSFSEVKEISVSGARGNIEFEIEMKGNKIVDIKVVEHRECDRIGGKALKELIPLIIKKQTYEVDSVVGATQTSEALKNAVKKALEN